MASNDRVITTKVKHPKAKAVMQELDGRRAMPVFVDRPVKAVYRVIFTEKG